MKLYLITGASRGIGAGFKKILSSKDDIEVMTIGRSIESDITVDLTSPTKVVEGFRSIDFSVYSKCVLINNAGTLDPIGPLGTVDSTKLQDSVMVNAVAPMVLINELIPLVKNTPLEIINISSGAGMRPISGWPVYCAGKSFINMLTQVVGLDSATYERTSSFIIWAADPGVVDTDMQNFIRQQSSDNFAGIERFKELKEKGELKTPLQAAQGILNFHFSEKYENGAVYHSSEIFK